MDFKEIDEKIANNSHTIECTTLREMQTDCIDQEAVGLGRGMIQMKISYKTSMGYSSDTSFDVTTPNGVRKK